QHRFDAEAFAPVEELVGADGVGLAGPPRQVDAGGPRADGADAVLPAVARDDAAAGVAHDGGPELADEVGDVGPAAVLVGGGVGGLEDAGVDAPAHVLDERPEDPWVDGPDREGRIKADAGCLHCALPEVTGV